MLYWDLSITIQRIVPYIFNVELESLDVKNSAVLQPTWARVGKYLSVILVGFPIKKGTFFSCDLTVIRSKCSDWAAYLTNA